MLDEAKSNEPLKYAECKKSYEITIGCKKGIGANIIAVVNGRKIAFARNEIGDKLYVTTPFFRSLSSGMLEGYTLGILDTKTKSLNQSVKEVEKILNDEGVGVSKIIADVRRVITYTTVRGYILELDGNGYNVLQEYIVE